MALSFASCIRDFDSWPREKVTAGDSTALVTLSLSLPPATRSVAGTVAENEVEEIDALLFTSDNNAFYYRASGTDITTASDATDKKEKKTFNVKLPYTPTGATSYRLVVVANARAALNNSTPPLAVSTIITSGTTLHSTIRDGFTSTVAELSGSTTDDKIPASGFPIIARAARAGASPDRGARRRSKNRCTRPEIWRLPHQGSPHALQGSPHALQGSPHALQGSPHALQGSPHALQGSSHALQGLTPYATRIVARAARTDAICNKDRRTRYKIWRTRNNG
ncbi:MAG: hypothetical protein LBG30_00340 [Odoribacteraceae bacterium]|jgi:uncharacterized ParB-like nuclease family protein|nr:hypothetical protein [Odoribacteraceae bacterium]